MREIKFRAWDGELMHSVAELIFDRGPKLDGKGIRFYGPGVGQGRIDGEKIVLMQYTGLKDKNGKEIYEGDVVFQEFYDNRPLEVGGFKGVVKQSEGAWWIDNSINHAERLWSETNINEVIGNIHENPELIKD